MVGREVVGVLGSDCSDRSVEVWLYKYLSSSTKSESSNAILKTR